MTPPRTVTPDNAQHLTRLRQLGGSPSLSGFRGQCLAFDAEGRHLVSVELGPDGRLQWWDLHADTSQPRATHSLGMGQAAGFLPGGESLVSVTVGGLLQEWSVAQGTLRREVGLELLQPGLSLTSQAELLLLTSTQGSALLWDARHWRPLRELQAPSLAPWCCALSPDGRLAVTGSKGDPGPGASGRVHFWEVSTGALQDALPLEAPVVQALAFDATGRWLAAGTSGGDIHLIDMASRRVQRTFRGPAPGVRNLSFSPDGSLLAVGGGMAAFLVLSTHDGAWRYQHGDDNDFQASTAVFSPDGRCIAWGQGDGTVGLWGVAG